MAKWHHLIGLLCLLTVFARGEEVWVTISHDSGTPPGQCTFPDILMLSLYVADAGRQLTLTIARDRHVIPLVPSIHLMSSQSGNLETLPGLSDKHDGVQGYHNHSYGAAFTVKCVRDDGYAPYFQLEGSLFLADHKYRVTPLTPWHQVIQGHPGQVTGIYNMDEVNEFKPADSAAKYFSRSIHTENIAQNKWRGKRDAQSNATYYIDVLTVVDSNFYSRFYNSSGGDQNRTLNNIFDYLSSMFVSANMRFETLSLAGRTVKVRMLTPYVLKTSNNAPYGRQNLEMVGNDYKISAVTLLDRFRDWLRANNVGKYDHAMFVTSTGIYGGGDNGIKFNVTKGLAYVGTMCLTNGESSSIIEDRGAYQSEGVVAHELAHSLGSGHDGENNLCSSADRYIMSDGDYQEDKTNDLNPWKFSKCSSEAILKRLEQIESNVTLLQSCLLDTTGSEPSDYQLISADQQCKLFYGNQSFICRDQNWTSLAILCDEFYCRIPGTNRCDRLSAATGTCCGNQKKCVQGTCVSAKEGECPVDEWCPFGDQEGVILDNKTCAQLEPQYCYTDAVNLRCCKTCRKYWTRRPGCDYGDKVTSCSSDKCGSTFTDGDYKDLPYSSACCATCNQQCIDENFLITESGEYTCNEYILQLDNKNVCYKENILKTSCCVTCEDARDTTNLDCPWGDRKDCSVLLNKRGYNCTAQQLQDCCQTCAQIRTVITTVATSAPSTQASTASTKPSTASTKASTASTKASTASTKASTASTKVSTASTKASTASTKASTASTKASTASTKASTASTKASTASTKASTASTKASTASTKASTASTKASTASTKASTASTKASAASTEASTASTKAPTNSPAATQISNPPCISPLGCDASVNLPGVFVWCVLTLVYLFCF